MDEPRHSSRYWGRIAVALLVALPGAVLFLFSLVALSDGIQQDAAVPVPIYLVSQTPLPKSIYRDAAEHLGRTAPDNGDAHIFGAEAGLAAGQRPSTVVRGLSFAVANSPANARGWMILSDAERPSDPKSAGSYLGQSLLLAPYDYWLAEPRAERAGVLWPSLDADTKAMAVRQTLLLWEEPQLRSFLFKLLSSETGIALAKQAFADHQDELRELNRWLLLQQQKFASGNP